MVKVVKLSHKILKGVKSALKITESEISAKMVKVVKSAHKIVKVVK